MSISGHFLTVFGLFRTILAPQIHLRGCFVKIRHIGVQDGILLNFAETETNALRNTPANV